MAMPAELANYTSEDDFVQRFLIPLLFRLGYSVVANYHGKKEYGKDLVFGEIDRFGHVVYYGLQAKYEDSIPLSWVTAVKDDVDAAFANEFVHPHTNKRELITRFYYVNAGTFSEYLPDDFFSRIKDYKRHTVLLDGKAVLALNRWATINRTTLITESLAGILIELHHNTVIGEDMAKNIDVRLAGENRFFFPRYRLAAINGFLSHPYVTPNTLAMYLTAYFSRAEQVNSIYSSTDPALSDSRFAEGRLRTCRQAVTEIEEMAKLIDSQATELLATLGGTLPFVIRDDPQ